MDTHEINIIVAEKIMGWRWDDKTAWHPSGGRYDNTGSNEFDWLPDYTGDIAAAWLVAEELKISVVPLSDGRWWAQVQDDGKYYDEAEGFGQWFETKILPEHDGIAETAPLAICLAALKARGVEV